ncbi:hypothetical protein H2199_007071 [Coniosporium tulheliwenetii]|uniref:Uncharacterized protein n=1 Tax=Coniosporium tulheliwenetii TaxID=3383036 RepID=A0ACC2YSN5_9PEZI|nr:hypothetical protein H2199_007071 [Cladosporium sp. JES 115]
MPQNINQPSNQIRLTNVSLVRMKKGKKRFEVACYKNKVLEWRSGTEKDLDNVLQIPNVFLNVSKGQVASKEDLAKSFGKDTPRDDIILEILKKGDIQVGEKEREAQLEQIHNEVIDIVAGKLVDPKSKGGTATPTNGEAEGGKTRELPRWTGVVTNKSAKSQALDAMKALIAHQPIPVSRARMRLRITCPTGVLKQAVKAAPKSSAAEDGEDQAKGTVKDRILSYVEQVETQDVLGEEWEVVGFVEPGAFKTLTEFIGTQTKGRARAEVLDMAVIHEGD